MLLQRRMAHVEDDVIDMTPMVDVVFQLMTFLLLTYNASGGPKVDVPVARHGLGVEEKQAVVLTLVPPASAGEKVQVYSGDDPDSDRPLASDELIRKVVSDALGQGRRKVILQADGTVPYGEVVRIASVVSEVEGIMLHIGVQEP